MSSGATSIYPQDNLNPAKSFSGQIYEFDCFRLFTVVNRWDINPGLGT